MTFKFKAPQAPARSDRPATNVDWDAINEMVFLATTAGKVKSIPGYITGLYSLGLQAREDAEEEAVPGKSYPESATFHMVGNKEVVRYPRKPVQTVAIAVDIPTWTVDYGPFFGGESNPTPYRALLNSTWGVFCEKEQKRVQTVTGFPLTEIKHDSGRWAFAKNSTLHKLAEAADLLDSDGLFTRDRIGELLGKCVQLQVQVSIAPSKDGTKKFLNEKVKIAGVVPEGLPVPELDESLIHGINFSGENDPDMVRKCRKVVKDTIKRALDYDTSDIKAVLESIESESPARSEAPKPRPEATSRPKPASAPKPNKGASWEDVLDADDVPF